MTKGRQHLEHDKSSKGKEVDGGSASQRHRGRLTNIGHFHKSICPTHFYKVILAPGLELLPIPDSFNKHMGTIPRETKLEMNTGCTRKVKRWEINERLAMDEGWASFAIAHKLQIGYLTIFKVLIEDTFRIIVINLSIAEVVAKCQSTTKHLS
ncbi:hypothetical protein ACQJBY_067772 [Aegilops geniculata]